MDNFIVSARKYRPTTFDSVIGQGAITNTLKNAIKNNHLAQAFLFCGPRGVGKTTCARILAKTINCENVSEQLEACDQCESCTSFNQSHSFNIHELDAASHNSVDDIRSLIEQVRIAPQVGNYSIYIIDEVHMLSTPAFNAFLKTLEEPPSYAIFILATTSKQRIIPTILSRCQIFDFSRIQVEDIALHLGAIAAEQGVNAEADGLHIIAQKADGSLRDALSIFDQMVSFGGKEISYNDVIENLNILDYDYYFKAINAILERNISDSLLLFDEVLSNGFDGHNFVTGLSEHMRNLLVCKDKATVGLLQVGERIKKRYLEQSQTCTSELLLDALSMANRCDIAYNTSINKRLHVELLLMQLCSVDGIEELEAPKVKIIAPAETVAKVEEPKIEYKKEEEVPTEGVSESIGKQVPLPEVTSESEVGESIEEQQEPLVTESNIETLSPEEELSELDEDSEMDDSKVYKMQTKSLRDFVKSSGETMKKADGDPPADNSLQSYKGSRVTQELFDEVWIRYAEQVKEQGKHSLYSTMTKRTPILGDNYIIKLDVDNSVQEAELNEEGSSLHEFLRKELDNGELRIEVNVLKNTEDRKPYTSMEKFKRMAEKNPSIEKFRKQLSLDID